MPRRLHLSSLPTFPTSSVYILINIYQNSLIQTKYNFCGPSKTFPKQHHLKLSWVVRNRDGSLLQGQEWGRVPDKGDCPDSKPSWQLRLEWGDGRLQGQDPHRSGMDILNLKEIGISEYIFCLKLPTFPCFSVTKYSPLSPVPWANCCGRRSHWWSRAQGPTPPR